MTRVGVRALLVLVAGLLAALLGAGPAAACSCADLSLEEQVDSADVVARVLVDRVEQPRVDGGRVVYHVSATRVWKGDVPMRFSFLSEQYGASCGLEGVLEGQDLLLFARGGGEGLPSQEPAVLTSSLCSGTEVATAGLVAQLTGLLGEGAVPVDGGDEQPGNETGLGWGWLLPAGVAVLAAIGLVLVLVRRRPRRR